MKKWTVLLVLTATLAACGAKEEAAPDSTIAAAAPASMESMAGDYDWIMQPEVGDTILGKGMSHQNADGTGYSVAEANPTDTVQFTATIQDDSVIMQSEPYTMTTLPQEVGQVTWRLVSPAAGAQAGPSTVTVSPVAKPDTVIMRARITATKR
jgi:predicted small lipoprotein YifL